MYTITNIKLMYCVEMARLTLVSGQILGGDCHYTVEQDQNSLYLYLRTKYMKFAIDPDLTMIRI